MGGSDRGLRRFLNAVVVRGHNLDLYVAVIVSVVVAVLALLGVASQETVLTLILAVLALMALGLLVQRDQNSRLLSALEELQRHRPLSDLFVAEDTSKLVGLMNDSQEVWLWGATLRKDIPMFDDALKRGLRAGKKFKFLLLEPEGNALKMGAARGRIGLTAMKSSHYSNLNRLMDLDRQIPVGTMEVLLSDYLGPYVLYIFDPDRESGIAFVRLPTLTDDDNARPTFWVSRKGEPEWFARFVEEFKGAASSAIQFQPAPDGGD